MTGQGNMTPPKVHNSSIAESKDTEMDEITKNNKSRMTKELKSDSYKI
jgi:hypothetical protein